MREVVNSITMPAMKRYFMCKNSLKILTDADILFIILCHTDILFTIAPHGRLGVYDVGEKLTATIGGEI